MPRSANNPPRPALGVSDHHVISRSGASYRRRQGRFSKSCSALGYNGYFLGNMLFYPSARGYRGLPRTSADFRFGLASPADPPLGDKQNHLKPLCLLHISYMEHRNGAHKHPIDARKLPNATQKLPDDTCMQCKTLQLDCKCTKMYCNHIAITPQLDCNCAAIPQVQPDCNCMQPDCNCNVMHYN